jgi:hypothetical protein
VKFELGDNPSLDIDFGGGENFGIWKKLSN